MGAFTGAVAALAAALCLLSLLLPEASPLRPSVKMLFAVLLLSLLLSPLRGGITLPSLPTLPDAEEGENAGEAWQKELLRTAYEAGAATAFSERFSVGEGDFSLVFTYGEEPLPPIRGKITLSGRALFLPLREVEKFLKENFCTEIEVILDVGNETGHAAGALP